MRGTLFLIVGPSGAGKDMLIRAARERLDESFEFPRRTITRSSDPEGEDHEAVDVASFDARERRGGFVLSWRAHGLAYGIPATIVADLERGKHVVVNVSRGVVEAARARFAPVDVILVTAPPDVLRARLVARGRESEAETAARLERVRGVAPAATIVNDGALQTAIDAFLAALQG